VKFESSLSATAIRRISSEGVRDGLAEDVLAVEEPLEIRIGYSADGRRVHNPISITMRTPGDDAELAVGFLFTEGIAQNRDQIREVRHCGRIGTSDRAADHSETNTIRVDLADGVELDIKRLERHFYTTSSCGVCGKSSIDALRTGASPLPTNTISVTRGVLNGLSETLRESQSVFDQTGGLHASALFDAEGVLDIVREDVGRHNALDKVIGRKFLDGRTPLNDRLLLVSGRASFELVQKALMAGIPIMAAVGAPSSLAVELAREFGMTLIGFLREGRFNIYCGEERVLSTKEKKFPAKSQRRKEDRKEYSNLKIGSKLS